MRWEYRVRPVSGLFILVTASVAVFALTKLGMPQVPALPSPVRGWTQTDLFKQISGYSILGLIGFELLLAARRRKYLRLGGRRRNWRAWHMTVGAILLPLVVLHTSGQMGANLNSWLLLSLIAVVVVGVSGKLIEAIHLQRLASAAKKGKSHASLGRLTAFLHKNWVHLHVLVVAVVLSLLSFHILAVYYF